MRLDNVWTAIFAGFWIDGLTSLTQIPAVTFTAASLDGIRIMTVWEVSLTNFTDAVFSFDRIPDVVEVPEPASLPLFAAALGALGLAYRRRGEAQG